MTAYFPLFVNMEHKKIRIYGAGRIAARRIGGLLRYGAQITVIAPQIHEEIQKYTKNPECIQIEQRLYCPGEICRENADFVLAATNEKEVNAAIYRECSCKGIPVNNASDSGQCDFYFPALIEQDNLRIGITSTDGNHKKVAEFSRKLRQLI